jgi:hypothetical protein
MSILKKLAETPENEMQDDDHMDRKGLSAEEIQQLLTEIGEKHKNAKAANPMTKEERNQRTADILHAMNTAKNPY